MVWLVGVEGGTTQNQYIRRRGVCANSRFLSFVRRVISDLALWYQEQARHASYSTGAPVPKIQGPSAIVCLAPKYMSVI